MLTARFYFIDQPAGKAGAVRGNCKGDTLSQNGNVNVDGNGDAN